MKINVYLNQPYAMTLNDILEKQQRIPKFGKPDQFMTVKYVILHSKILKIFKFKTIFIFEKKNLRNG
jgi:hypothetical protein